MVPRSPWKELTRIPLRFEKRGAEIQECGSPQLCQARFREGKGVLGRSFTSSMPIDSMNHNRPSVVACSLVSVFQDVFVFPSPD